MYLIVKFHHPTCNCSEIIVLTNKQTDKLDSIRWFSHRRSPSSSGAMQWYRLLQLAEYGLATAHALLCIVNGDNSAFFSFFFVPGDLDLWPLTFEHGRDFCKLYLTAKFDRPTFSRSKVILRTNTMTNKQTSLKASTALRYSTPMRNEILVKHTISLPLAAIEWGVCFFGITLSVAWFTCMQ